MIHCIRKLDSEISYREWAEILQWMKQNVEVAYPNGRIREQVTYERDGDHDGYWVFTFKNESDKVRFILRWL